MNICVAIILLSLLELPELPEHSRANRQAQRNKTIAHNRRIYYDKVGRGIWFEKPDKDVVCRRYSGGNSHRNKQEGRWATHRLSGHRRFEKWCREAYPSFVDEKATARWEEELRDYLDS